MCFTKKNKLKFNNNFLKNKISIKVYISNLLISISHNKLNLQKYRFKRLFLNC